MNARLNIAFYGIVTALAVVAILTLATGCAAGDAARGDTGRASQYAAGPETVSNHYGTVAQKSGGEWRIEPPPRLRFTGRTATGAEIQEWGRANGIRAVGVVADTRYAQLDSQSAIQLALWTKRLLWDIGYTYVGDARDCDNFARVARTIPDLFAESAPEGAQAAVFGIYAQMKVEFAGITDGSHALGVAWTDKGVPVFEPQGIDLTYQDVRAWPNKDGISRVRYD